MIINENGQGNAPVVEEAPAKKTKKQLAAEAVVEVESTPVEEKAE